MYRRGLQTSVQSKIFYKSSKTSIWMSQGVTVITSSIRNIEPKENIRYNVFCTIEFVDF